MPEDVAISLESMDSARAYLRQNPAGSGLITCDEWFEQIKQAEAAGGFTGGMTGSGTGGAGGYSTSGNVGADSSGGWDSSLSTQDESSGGPDTQVSEGRVGVWVNAGTEVVLALKDLYELWEGIATSPVLLVPMEDLKRWMDGGTPPDGA